MNLTKRQRLRRVGIQRLAMASYQARLDAGRPRATGQFWVGRLYLALSRASLPPNLKYLNFRHAKRKKKPDTVGVWGGAEQELSAALVKTGILDITV